LRDPATVIVDLAMGGSPHIPTLRTLVVDDDRLMVEVVSIVLRDLGLQHVDVATDGASALERLSASSFDLLVCDLNMPEMDGARLLAHVAALPARPSIILFSGEDPRILETARQFAEAKALTILGTLSKPVTHARIFPLLEAWRPAAEARASLSMSQLDSHGLCAGLANGAIALAYQPKVDVRDERTIGAEALLRWGDPQGGIVSPEHVVRVAEECGLIDDITLRVLALAVQDRAMLLAAGVDLPVACNVSMHNLREIDIVDRMHAIVVDSGDEPTRYTLEVTETHLIDDLASVLEALIRLRLRGFRIAIDDYGTGAATMQFLTQLPSSELKIDRRFVVEASRNDAGRALLRSAIALGNALDQVVVAEGVETAEDVRMLRELGCRYAQGYHFARPMPAGALATWMSQHH
jgi:EAL domain-containing protein (putative c-di-GMP-specific phosphodiesterase class I)/AmiR/NasT family two-component response regulator